MGILAADLREAGRTLLKQPRFLIIASLTLALGIGAVTAIFSVVNGVLFRPLPYPHADRLVNIWSNAPGLGYDQFPLSPDLFLFYRRHNQVFEDMALFQRRRANSTEARIAGSRRRRRHDAQLFRDARAQGSRAAGLIRPTKTSRRPARRRAQPSFVDAALRRRSGARRADRPRRRRADAGGRHRARPGWIKPGSADLWLPARFNAANPPTGNFGWNAVGAVEARACGRSRRRRISSRSCGAR